MKTVRERVAELRAQLAKFDPQHRLVLVAQSELDQVEYLDGHAGEETRLMDSLGHAVECLERLEAEDKNPR